VPSPLVGEPDVLVPRAHDVPRSDPRRLLRDEGLHEIPRRPPRPAMYGDGVRDRDDPEELTARREDRGGPDHAPSGRPDFACSASQDLSRRMADPTVLLAVEPAVAFSRPRARAPGRWGDRLRPRDAGLPDRRRESGRPYAPRLEPRDPPR